MTNQLIEKTKNLVNKNKEGIFIYLYALLNCTLIYYCLELGNKNPFFNGIFYTFVNIMTVFVLMSFVYILVGRWWISSIITGLPLVMLGIANYYTLMYRNSPISTQDIHNFGTTMSVIGSYKFPITAFVIGIIVFGALIIATTVQLFKYEKKSKKTFKIRAVKSLCLIIIGCTFIHFMYFAKNPIKPKDTFVWSWEDSYHRYGYAASSIEVFQKSLNMVDRPQGYSNERLKNSEESKTVLSTPKKTPDIILILNESFYDLRDLTDVKTDNEVTPFLQSLKHTGRTVVAGTGGGTNKSEYELLTSNTIQLMPGITPFNYLDFNDANSIVTHLESLGYTTWGAHCAEAINYSRAKVYPKLGFDKILFREDFGEIEKYGERYYATDEFCYEKMISDYEEMGEEPRFMYLLTIQNHGGWELNDEKWDTIKSLSDFGEYTDDVSEFLSCMNQTDKAFKKLTEYFENSQREVIICMVGDHAPSFATELLDNIDIDKTFKLRSTPYAIWSNFEMEASFPKTLSMPMMVPHLLKAGGNALTPFYSHMINMAKDTPVLTAFGIYRNKHGETFNYKQENKYKRNIDLYFDMVYNNVMGKEERIQNIFTYKGE